MDKTELPEDDKFSNDPEENLDMENQFLQLKLMTEHGASFGGEGNVPPEIMNEWLKSVARFEEHHKNAVEQPVREILGNPVFSPSADLEETAFEVAFERLQSLLDEAGIHVDFLRERTDRFKYDFITGELFDYKTVMYPGMMTGFIYEEFHPDHELDIQNGTEEFFNAFFGRRLGNTEVPFFRMEIIHPDGTIIPGIEMAKMFQIMYDAVPEFENTRYEIEKIDFEFQENDDPDTDEEFGMGYSEGRVAYDMIFRNGERERVDGSFKIYFNAKWDYWFICFFYLAGFNLHRDDKDSAE